MRPQVESETSLVTEDVEGLAVRVPGRRRIILALVKKRARLLSFFRVVVELNAIHGQERRRLAAVNDAALAHRQLLELAHMRLNPFDDSFRLHFLDKSLDECFSNS